MRQIDRETERRERILFSYGIVGWTTKMRPKLEGGEELEPFDDWIQSTKNNQNQIDKMWSSVLKVFNCRRHLHRILTLV